MEQHIGSGTANGMNAEATLADRLRDAARGLASDRVPLASLVQAHGSAAQGSQLLLLAVACMLPIPGTGTVLGFGLLAMAVAMWRGRQDALLPRRVVELEMPGTWARRLLTTLSSIYAAAGRVARPRACGPLRAAPQALIAALVAAMAVLVILPIPFGNFLPALALVLIGLGQAFRDGLMVVAGTLAAGAVAVLMSTLAVAGAGWGLAWVAGVAA